MDPTKPLFNPNEIKRAVRRIAQEVLAWSAGTKAGPLQIVSILEGGRPFASALISEMGRLEPLVPVQLHEICVRATQGKALLEAREWNPESLKPEIFEGQKILLVDDLADSGKTLSFLKSALGRMNPLEIKTAVLLRKFGLQSGPADFIGFDLDWNRKTLAEKGLRDRWLFGFGMDLDGGSRDSDHIGFVEIPL